MRVKLLKKVRKRIVIGERSGRWYVRNKENIEMLFPNYVYYPCTSLYSAESKRRQLIRKEARRIYQDRNIFIKQYKD
jgi:hypothetical protein